MAFTAQLGQYNSLRVVRLAPPGAYLDGGEKGEILLPRRYVPADLAPGRVMEVFVYRDSEDRLVATTEKPTAMLDEIASLQVLSVNPRVGAFLDWGLAKDLLLPFREQADPVRAGQNVVVRICLDPTTDRIMATSRLNRYLNQSPPSYRDGQPVNIIITGRTPLG